MINLPGTTTTFFGGWPFVCRLHRIVLEREPLDRRAIGGFRRPHMAAELAVHLQHELDLVGFQRGLVDLRPWCSHDVTELPLKPQLGPQLVGHMRHDRVDESQKHPDTFVEELPPRVQRPPWRGSIQGR